LTRWNSDGDRARLDRVGRFSGTIFADKDSPVMSFIVRAAIVGFVLGAWSGSALATEPKTCSEAYQACIQKQCDAGCKRTCASRYNGCVKTGAFSMPGLLLRNLRRY
jgi:hypothetical protein